MDNYRIGFHARSIQELERVIKISGVNLAELKPYQFKENERLYFFDGERFRINKSVAEYIKKICNEKKVTVQIHLLFEKKTNPQEESGLCQAIEGHHELILARYDMLGELLKDYGIGTVITTHPPAFKFGKRVLCGEEEALEVGRLLYSKIDELVKEKGYNFRIGLENMLAPKNTGSSCVGYKPDHIDRLLGDTSEIGITVDTGHRILNKEMSIAKLFSCGKVVNLHLHSNSGNVSDKDYSDDEHAFATPQNLPHYGRFITSIRRFKMPVVLEVDKIGEFDDGVLKDYVLNFRNKIVAQH